MQVPCPRCKKPSEYSTQNPYRPFCSERCQLIDLGKWASGDYSIPLQKTSLAENALPTDDSGENEES